MRNLRLLSFLFLFTLLFGGAIHAQSTTSVEGCQFEVSNVESGTWKKARHHLVNDWVKQADSLDDAMNYVAISYRFINANDSKKVDLTEGFKFALEDDLGNQYRQIKKPEEYGKPVLLVSKNFPSIYPGEAYGETIFFEAPIAKASSLKLHIDVTPLGAKNPVVLSVRWNQGQGVAVPKNFALPENKVSVPAFTPASFEPGIDITFPESGQTFEQGDLIHLRVAVTGAAANPERIIVNAFNHTYTDNNPSKENVYDVVVPADAPCEQAIINVIAAWPGEGDSKPVESDNLFILVRSKSLISY